MAFHSDASATGTWQHNADRIGMYLVFGHLAPMALLATIWGVHTYTSEAAWREYGYFGTRDSTCCGLSRRPK